MKFKQQDAKEANALYVSLTKLLQIEEDKLSLIEAAMSYFYMQGNMVYKKFFKHLHKACIDFKLNFQFFLYECCGETPERKISSFKLDTINDNVKLFETLASVEDKYVEELNNAINLAYDAKQWDAFHYLLDKFGKIDHLCCRAAAAVKDGNNPADLIQCEQHSSEK